jgi:hypothetical protein
MLALKLVWDNPPPKNVFLQNKKNHVTCFCTKSWEAQKKLAQEYHRQNLFRVFSISPPLTSTPQRQAHAKPQKKTSWIELVKGYLCLGTKPFNKKTMREKIMCENIHSSLLGMQQYKPKKSTTSPGGSQKSIGFFRK